MHPALTSGAHAIITDGVEQRYHVHGAGPVCVVHPGGPGLSWHHLRVPCLERSNTLVYVEPIGTGGSGRLPETDFYTLARYATHLRAIVETVGGPETALLGHDHGGSVPQQYITTYPDSVRALVLVCSTPTANGELIRETEEDRRHARCRRASVRASTRGRSRPARGGNTRRASSRRGHPRGVQRRRGRGEPARDHR